MFVGTDRVTDVLAAQPRGVATDDAGRRSLARDGQARLWWEGTPIDLFLSSHPFHDDVQGRCRSVPFAGAAALPVLGCTDLAVFKAFGARPKDAVDIAAMAEADAVDVELLTATITGLLGPDSPNVAFVQDALGMGRRR